MDDIGTMQTADHEILSEEDAGEFLHNLHNKKPDISYLKKVIDKFPNALLYENEEGDLPIQTIVANDGVRYVTVLAEEAVTRVIGPERGGLLLTNSCDRKVNILQSLVNMGYPYSPSRSAHLEDICLVALEAFRNIELFINEDIAHFRLLNYASYKQSQKRFEYLLDISSVQEAGEWLHHLRHLNPDVFDVTNVKKVIDKFPNALLHANKKGDLPIQATQSTPNGIKHIALLAEEAATREIGLERGGLLLTNPDNLRLNVLQSLAHLHYADSPAQNADLEDICLDALKALRVAKLFVDTDFARFNLLGCAAYKQCQKRFKELVNIYPISLSTPLPNGDYPIHAFACVFAHDREAAIFAFTTSLKYGMKYYPQNFGFLFSKNGKGISAINQAIATFGKNETMRIVQQMIPPTEDHPILHYVYKYTPDLADDFVYWYPDAERLKDSKGRHLLHVAMKRGLKWSPSLSMMIHCDKESLEEKDPVSNLYPFMLAATSGHPKDLTTIYRLLRYCPGVLIRCLDNKGTNENIGIE